MCMLQVTSYKLQATCYKSQAASYKLQVTSYKLQAAARGCGAVGVARARLGPPRGAAVCPLRAAAAARTAEDDAGP